MFSQEMLLLLPLEPIQLVSLYLQALLSILEDMAVDTHLPCKFTFLFILIHLSTLTSGMYFTGGYHIFNGTTLLVPIDATTTNYVSITLLGTFASQPDIILRNGAYLSVETPLTISSISVIGDSSSIYFNKNVSIANSFNATGSVSLYTGFNVNDLFLFINYIENYV